MNKINKIILNSPLDMHLHLRDEKMLELVAPLSAKYFSGALIMPNLVPPITAKKTLLAYKTRIQNTTKNAFTPFMTLFFQNYSQEFLESIKEDILAIKMYPAGITTNSENGVNLLDLKSLAPTLKLMTELGIVLCVHGESSGFVMDREKEFLPIYESLALAYPNLTIIMEHITTKEACELSQKYDNLYASITLHHLLFTLDDLAGGFLKPHLFCKPILKTHEDKEALLSLALEANPKVMFGSDSAPHPKDKKEACGCAAGVFTAPLALQALCSLFSKHKKEQNLNKFLSLNARSIYNLNKTNFINKNITLIKKNFLVPKSYDLGSEKVVPLFAGEELDFSIEEISTL